MRAVQYAEHGGPEVLRLVEVDEPHPRPGRLRVAVKAVGVNPADGKQLRGLMPAKLPRIPGFEVAGVVDEVGDGADGTVGDQVFGSPVGGGAAEYAVLTAWARMPPGLSFASAAGLVVAAEASARALNLLDVSPGRVLLVNGASGGVGSVAVQLARSRGLRVIGTAAPANHAYLRELGATPTAYGTGLAGRVRALAAGGVDAAFDAGGRGALAELIAVTGGPDRVVTIADYEGAERLGVRFSGAGDGRPRAWYVLPEAAALVERGELTVRVAATFPLEAAAEAFALLEKRHSPGKLVLVV